MKKSLEGISSSQELLSTLKEIVILKQEEEEEKDEEPKLADDDDNGDDTTREHNKCEIKRALSPSLTVQEAVSLVKLTLDAIMSGMDGGEDTNNDDEEDENKDQLDDDKKDGNVVIPLKTISAAKSLLQSSTAPTDTKDKLKEQLETFLKKQRLVFTRCSNENDPEKRTKEQEAFQKRLTMLRLRQQERNYSGLTSNIDKRVEQDETISGMMYATSVGANMIVAPITFGVFMYFFGAKFFSWMDDHQGGGSQRKEGQLDVRGVIVGVISGVIMLFIEMILFVIRNHEMDKYMTKKKKTDRTNAFGYNKKRAERTFMG